jgi:hypothetical protein
MPNSFGAFRCALSPFSAARGPFRLAHVNVASTADFATPRRAELTKERSPEVSFEAFQLRGEDLNLRPSGYEPDELPGCSTARQ